MFLGVWFLAKQVSIEVLWWLALAIMIRDAFRRLALASRREGCCGLGSMEERKLVSGDKFVIVLFRIPERFMAVMLSLRWCSASTSMFLSKRSDSEFVGGTSDMTVT